MEETAMVALEVAKERWKVAFDMFCHPQLVADLISLRKAEREAFNDMYGCLVEYRRLRGLAFIGHPPGTCGHCTIL